MDQQGAASSRSVGRTCSLMKPAASFWSYRPPSSSKEAIFSSYRLYGDFRPTTITLPCAHAEEGIRKRPSFCEKQPSMQTQRP